MQEESIHKLISERALRTLFQPIIDGGSRTVLGHEALTRGLLSGLESPMTLIELAGRLADARHVFTEFLIQMRRQPKHVRKAQAEWIAIAENSLSC